MLGQQVAQHHHILQQLLAVPGQDALRAAVAYYIQGSLVHY
jgi:hypothetical protein